MPEGTTQPIPVGGTTQPPVESGSNIVLYIVLGIVVIIILSLIAIYNSLVRLRNKVNEAWADIETQLKRRYDLIPNLVETVKGYAGHEKGTLEGVTHARTQAMQATTPAEKAASENMLSETLKSIFALSENYPDLKANQNFMDLQATLREIEEHIQMSRRYYNGTVRDFNNSIQVFPNNIFSSMFGFSKREFFGIENAGERENVKVSFQK